MHLKTALLLAVCYHCFEPLLAKEPQFGGYDLEVRKFPFVVAITFGPTMAGNGAILAPRWVVSTANTFYQTPHREYIAHLGANTVGGGEKYQNILIIQHPEWTGYTANIAMMKLSRKIRFGPAVKPIKLIDTDPDRVEDALMLSYGKNEDNTAHLRGGRYTLTSDESCVAILDTDYAKDVIHQRHGYCMYSSGEAWNKGQWIDDTGAPIIYNDRLVALWILRDDEKVVFYNNVSVATRVYGFGGWIESTMNHKL